MNLSNTEVKLVMELCKGRSLAEQIRNRKGRVGEKVACVLAEGVRALFLSPFFSFDWLLTHRLSPSHIAFATTTHRSELNFELAGPARPCVLAL
jgi:hypothetical protein